MSTIGVKIENAGIALLFLALSILSPHKAWADHDDPFVQVTCSPELDYFFVRTFHVMDTGDWNDDDRAKEIRKDIPKEGIYDFEDFTKHGYHCQLPTRDISVKLDRYYPATGGSCEVDNARLKVDINENTVYSFDAFGDGCADIGHQLSFYRVVGINDYDKSFIQDCAYAEGAPFRGGKAKEWACKEIETPISEAK